MQGSTVYYTATYIGVITVEEIVIEYYIRVGH